jgi:hypothetical protein
MVRLKRLTREARQKNGSMLKTTDTDRLMTHFTTPAHDALSNCEHRRNCPDLSDPPWIQIGVERSIKECKTGRGFLQDWAMSNCDDTIGVSHFLERLKSQRRLNLITEVNTNVAASMPTHPDARIEALDDLAKIDLYAEDGHYHATSTHELPINCKRRAVGQLLYA